MLKDKERKRGIQPMGIDELTKQQAKFILVGCDSSKERDGMSEFYHVLVKFLKEEPIEILELSIRGLFLVALKNDPSEITQQIAKIISEKKFNFIACKKLTPLKNIIKSSLKELTTVISDEITAIPEKAKWKISINRRYASIKRNDIIELIASHSSAPKGKVDLENPDWEINIEVFGGWLGYGVYPRNSVISLKE
ncbi:MAG: THUMP domain-containing protein [Candidatus Heimdallarchaeota archaeon]